MVSGAGAAARYEQVAAALPSSAGIAVIEGVVVDDIPADEGRRLLLQVDGIFDDGSAEAQVPRGSQGLIALRVFSAVDVEAGDRIRVRGRLTRAEPALSPATYDSALAARTRFIHAAVSVHDAADLAVMARGQSPLLVRARLGLRERLMSHVPPRLAGLLLALLIGDVSLFEDEQNTAYRHVGAGHLLAVSGLQVTLLAVVHNRFFGGLFLLVLPVSSSSHAGDLGGGRVVGRVGLRRHLRHAALGVRAAVMASAVVRRWPARSARHARRRDRRCGPAHGARVAGLDRRCGISAQLRRRDRPRRHHRRCRRRRRRPVAPALEQGEARADRLVDPGFATVPLSAWLFGQVAPAGLVANIVLVPVASLLQLPSLLCGLVGAVFDCPSSPGSAAKQHSCSRPWSSASPRSSPACARIEPPSLFGAAIGIAASLFAGGAAMIGHHKSALVAVVVAAIVYGASAYEAPALRISFLRGGQGDGAVLEFPDGTVFVVDAGGRVPFDPRATEEGRAEALAEPGKRVVVPFLQRRGIERVDVVVVSHPIPIMPAACVRSSKRFLSANSGSPAMHTNQVA